MRFKQYLKESQFANDRAKIEQILWEMGLDGVSEIVEENGQLIVNTEVGVNSAASSLVAGKLPIRFGNVDGSFDVSYCHLESLEGFPKEVTLYVSLKNNPNLKSLQYCPKIIGTDLNIQNTGITSFVGINEMIDKIGGEFVFEPLKIKSGGVGLVLIDVKKLTMLGRPTSPPFAIIEKYLGRPDDIFDCQTELIDNGFEEFAKL